MLTTHLDEVDSDYRHLKNGIKLMSFRTFSKGSAKNKVCIRILDYKIKVKKF